MASVIIGQSDCRGAQTSSTLSGSYAASGVSDAITIFHNGNDTVGSTSAGRLFFQFGTNVVNLQVRVGCSNPVSHGPGDYLDVTNARRWPAIVTFDYTPDRGVNRDTTFSFYFTLDQPGSAAANRLESFSFNVGKFGVEDDPACDSSTRASSQKSGAAILGWQVGQMAQHRASQRVQRPMSGDYETPDGGQGGGASFADLATAKVQGWTALDSDEALGLYQDWQTRRMMSKLEGLNLEGLNLESLGLEGLGLEGLGSDTARLVEDLLGSNGTDEALNWYTAGAYGDFDKQGAAAFDGIAQVWTAGGDYRFSRNFVLGGNLNYEHAKLDFDAAADGRLTKRGWRSDAYAGWALGTGWWRKACSPTASSKTRSL